MALQDDKLFLIYAFIALAVVLVIFSIFLACIYWKRRKPDPYKPLPPIIVPSSGEITDQTLVSIVPPGKPEYYADTSYYYSLDRSYPSTEYREPFTLKALPGGAVRTVTISAVASIDRFASEVVHATLDVTAASSTMLDPSIPSPSALIEVSNPLVYFSHERSDVRIKFILRTIEEMRQDENDNESDGDGGNKRYKQHAGGSSNGSRPNVHETGLHIDPTKVNNGAVVRVYNHKSISLSQDVGEIIAWVVAVNHPEMESARTRYDVNRHCTMDQMQSNPRKKKPSELLPPAIYLSCADVRLLFESIPACYDLRYTLDGTEPSLHRDDRTYRFNPGQSWICPMRGEYKSVHIVARYFYTNQETGDSSYGLKFSRIFGCHAA